MNKSTWIWIGVFCMFILIISLCIWGIQRARHAKNNVDKWANSPGTSGFINLDEVQKSCLDKNNTKTENFEQRVNEIFEGDNLILLDIQGREKGFLLTAVEDLNKNQKPDPLGSNGDEVVFKLEVLGSGPNNARLTGAGVNSDFKSTFTYPMPNIDQAYSDNYYRRHNHYPYFYSYYGTRYRYYTPRRRYVILGGYRRNYRMGPRYRAQIITNGRYYSGYRTRYPRSASTFSRTSAARKGYVSRSVSSHGFNSRVGNSQTARTRSSLSSSGKISSSSGRSSSGRSSGGFSSGLGRTASSSYSRSRGSSGFRVF